MKIFYWNDILEFLNTGIQDDFFAAGTGISIGCFDGVHLGHRELLSRLVNGCKENCLKSGVVTFSRPLPSFKHSKDYKGDVSSLDRRLDIIESLGVDFAIIVDFDDAFASQLGADFLNILINACNMELLAEGVDFRCGYKGATDVQAIKYFGEKNKVKTIFVEPVYYREGTDEEERISSSYIREMITKGFFSTVTELLGREYDIDVSNAMPDKDNKRKKQFLDTSCIKQVLPPDGAYRVYDEDGNEVRLCIKGNLISLEIMDRKDFEFKRVIFK